MDQALNGRTKLIRVMWGNISSECIFENGLSGLDEEAMFIGVTIGSLEDAFKQAITGPSPEDKDKALEFRKFWGDKSTLRWFRDGKIAEVVGGAPIKRVLSSDKKNILRAQYSSMINGL